VPELAVQRRTCVMGNRSSVRRPHTSTCSTLTTRFMDDEDNVDWGSVDAARIGPARCCGLSTGPLGDAVQDVSLDTAHEAIDRRPEAPAAIASLNPDFALCGEPARSATIKQARRLMTAANQQRVCDFAFARDFASNDWSHASFTRRTCRVAALRGFKRSTSRDTSRASCPRSFGPSRCRSGDVSRGRSGACVCDHVTRKLRIT